MIDTSKAVASSVELRKLCLKLAFHAGDNAAHLGGALSCTDFISVILNTFDFKTPESFNSVILSKGHACLIFYASLIYNQIVLHMKKELMQSEVTLKYLSMKY